MRTVLYFHNIPARDGGSTHARLPRAPLDRASGDGEADLPSGETDPRALDARRLPESPSRPVLSVRCRTRNFFRFRSPQTKEDKLVSSEFAPLARGSKQSVSNERGAVVRRQSHRGQDHCSAKVVGKPPPPPAKTRERPVDAIRRRRRAPGLHFVARQLALFAHRRDHRPKSERFHRRGAIFHSVLFPPGRFSAKQGRTHREFQAVGWPQLREKSSNVRARPRPPRFRQDAGPPSRRLGKC